jgi:hypothetical protein
VDTKGCVNLCEGAMNGGGRGELPRTSTRTANTVSEKSSLLGFSVNRGYLPLAIDVSLSKDAPRFAGWHYAGAR